MNPPHNHLIIFHLLPTMCYLLSALYIFASRGNKRTTNYMALVRLFTGLLLVVNVLQYFNTPYYMQVLWNPIHLAMSLLVHPLVFVYVYSLVHPQKIFRGFWLITYGALGIFILLYFMFEALGYSLPPITDYNQVKAHIHNPALWLRFGAAVVWVAEISVFGYLALKMLRQHRKNLSSEFSYTEGVSLAWLKWAILAMIGECVIALLAVSLEGLVIKPLAAFLMTIESIITTIFVLRQKDLYEQPSKKELQLIDAVSEQPTLPEESLLKREVLKQNLLRLLEEDEIFKDPELNSEKVREMLYTNRTYLSQVINQDLNTNFYNLINNYRLKKAVAMMSDTKHSTMPLKNISEICGFKSMSAFSTVFKQVYGKTPTEWKMEN